MKNLNKIVAYCLALLADLFIEFCYFHDKIVKKIRDRWPKSERFLKKKVFLIKGSQHGQKNTIYLKRFVILRLKNHRFYLHRFMRTDEEIFHDHPWEGSFLQLRGSYTEQYLKPDPMAFDELQTLIKPFGFGYFKVFTQQRELLDWTTFDSRRIHRVTVEGEFHDQERKAPMTFGWVRNFKKTPEGTDNWGFWKKAEVENPLNLDLWQRIHYLDFLTQDDKSSH